VIYCSHCISQSLWLPTAAVMSRFYCLSVYSRIAFKSTCLVQSTCGEGIIWSGSGQVSCLRVTALFTWNSTTSTTKFLWNFCPPKSGTENLWNLKTSQLSFVYGGVICKTVLLQTVKPPVSSQCCRNSTEDADTIYSSLAAGYCHIQKNLFYYFWSTAFEVTKCSIYICWVCTTFCCSVADIFIKMIRSFMQSLLCSVRNDYQWSLSSSIPC